jgi:hypothetical protein
MTAKDHDQERQEIIRRLGQEEVRLHAKMHSLETERQRVHFELADLHRAQGRAAGPLPAGGICPTCWISRGEQVPSTRDALVCPKCGREDLRDA